MSVIWQASVHLQDYLIDAQKTWYRAQEFHEPQEARTPISRE